MKIFRDCIKSNDTVYAIRRANQQLHLYQQYLHETTIKGHQIYNYDTRSVDHIYASKEESEKIENAIKKYTVQIRYIQRYFPEELI